MALEIRGSVSTPQFRLMQKKLYPALRICTLALATILAGQSLHSIDSHPVWLAQDSRPQAQILIPGQATETELFAAAELRDYLEKMTGARLTILPEGEASGDPAILVGNTLKAPPELKSKDADAFIVRRQNGSLIIAGASDRGTLYGVYDFLERELGCRWLGPGPHWEIIPETPDLALPSVDRLEQPLLRYRKMREVGNRWRPDNDILFQGASWTVKNKINVSREWPGRSEYRQTGDPGEIPVPMRAWIRPHTTGSVILPADSYFDDNPEWYAVVPKGYRYEYRDTGRSRGHLCLTHPEVRERVAGEIIAMFNQQPHKEMITLASDGGDYFCQCEACMELYSGRRWHRDGREHTAGWITFVNAVAEQVAEVHTDKKIMTMGYRTATAPPRPGESPPPHPMVVAQLATWSPVGCRMHRIESEDCRVHTRFRDVYEDWRAVTPGGMMLYEYIPRGSMQRMPYGAARILADDIRYLYERGLIGYQGQTTWSQWASYGLVKYVVAKAMWDPYLDVDSVIQDYCDHAFGPASGPMQQFYDTLEAGLDNANCSWGGIYDALDPDTMKQARSHLDRAHAAAAGDTVIERRLRTMEVEFLFAEMAVAARRMQIEARDNEDAELMRQAVELGQQAVDFVHEEDQREPHYALHPSGFARQVSQWRRHLQNME